MKNVQCLFFLLFFFFITNTFILASERYQIKTNSTLNVRSGPGTSYGVIGSLQNNSYVEVVDFIDGWAAISLNGQKGYVSQKYLQKSEISNSSSDDITSRVIALDFWKKFLIGIIVLFITILALSFFDTGGWFTFILLIALPIMILVYFLSAPSPMWFLSPSNVGWVWTIINGFGFLMLLSFMWGSIKSFLGDTIRELFREQEYVSGLISLVFLLLYALAMWNAVMTAIMELFIIGILMVIGSAGGSKYMGSFTDRDGNSWDVYRD